MVASVHRKCRCRQIESSRDLNGTFDSVIEARRILSGNNVYRPTACLLTGYGMLLVIWEYAFLTSGVMVLTYVLLSLIWQE